MSKGELSSTGIIDRAGSKEPAENVSICVLQLRRRGCCLSGKWFDAVVPQVREEEEERICTTPSCEADPVYNPYGLAPTAMRLTAMNCSATRSTCYPGHDLLQTTAADPPGCCAICSSKLGCVLNKSQGKPVST